MAGLLLCGWIVPGALAAGEPSGPPAEALRKAVEKSVRLLESSRAEYLHHRQCFSCHHQALPTLALVTARSRGFEVDEQSLQEQLRVTAQHLERNRENYQQGRGQGGRLDTAGYALFTLHLGEWKPDATTSAVVEYLLLSDRDDGHWRTAARRPPTQASSFTTTYLALRGLKAFAVDEQQQQRAAQRIEAARAWLQQATPRDTEDRVFRLLALHLLEADAEQIQAATQDLLRTQRDDGGWAQIDEQPSDPYATATALVALHLAGRIPVDEAVYQRGLHYLLHTQDDDGSWHVATRSRPFQVYFESGFPHGKDQFISIAASSWATTALALSLPADAAGRAGQAASASTGP
jgi:squalene cyclase